MTIAEVSKKYDITPDTLRYYERVVYQKSKEKSCQKSIQEIQKLCPDSKVEKGMNIVFTEDYNENQLVTSHDEIDKWIKELQF